MPKDLMTDGIIASFPHQGGPQRPAAVAFDRREFDQIMRLYGRMVAAGEWRDYALDFNAQSAVFSIFRRSSELPVFRIEKSPAQARRQGAYTIYGMGGQILKRGHDLSQALKIFDRKLMKLVEG
jgi:hypothetical protein